MASNNFTLDLKAKVDVNSVKQQLKQISNTTTLKIDVDGTKAITEMNKFESKVGDVYTEMKKLDSEGNVLSSTFTKTTSATKNLSGTIEGLGRKLQSINGIFQATKNLVVNFQQFLEPLFEFDEALTEFKKVSDLSGDSLDSYTKKLGQMGEEVARTRTEMVAASTEYVKSGYSEEDAATLSRVTALFQNVADSEIDAGDAASFIISQLKAFNYNADQAESVVNALNEVSNNFAVSSTDISTGLSKTSSAMSVLGNDFSETIGLITAGTEIMSGQASKVARGLRTIGNNFANAAKQADSFEIQVGGVTKSISLIDESTGDIKSTFDIFEDLSEDWDKMSNAEKQSVALTYAGKLILAQDRFNCGKEGFITPICGISYGCLKLYLLNYNSNIMVA